MKKIFKKEKVLFLMSFVLGLVLNHCGASTNQTAASLANQAAIGKFKGIDKITKQDAQTWLLAWAPVDVEGALYAVYQAPEGQSFNYNSPVITSSINQYKYVSTNIFAEKSQCFVVRVANGAVDQNVKQLCNQATPLQFTGITSIARQSDGGYLITWPAIPVTNVIYALFERLDEASYDFTRPSFDAIKNNFQKTDLVDRGHKICFDVRYSATGLPTDTNSIEKCTDFEPLLNFAGIASLDATNSTTVTIGWIRSSDTEITKYNIYEGSDFSQLVATVDASTDANSYQIAGLVPSRQYSFGVRAADTYSREDSNIIIRSIVMPSQ